ncbi:MAG: hypothetical protein RIB60_05525 [Phycisphaerales bacterium]
MRRRWPDTNNELRTPGRGAEPRRLTQGQVIERILELNPTARQSFLSRFTPDELRSYLDHLTTAAQPRGEASRWVRPGDTSAIMSCSDAF